MVAGLYRAVMWLVACNAMRTCSPTISESPSGISILFCCCSLFFFVSFSRVIELEYLAGFPQRSWLLSQRDCEAPASSQLCLYMCMCFVCGNALLPCYYFTPKLLHVWPAEREELVKACPLFLVFSLFPSFFSNLLVIPPCTQTWKGAHKVVVEESSRTADLFFCRPPISHNM
jgi:hypothetical protein